MLKNTNQVASPKVEKKACASSAKRALVNVVLRNGFIASYDPGEMKDFDAWSDRKDREF